MSNRFATTALIVLVSILGGVVLFGVGLFMFPGVTLFGLKYVASGTHACGPTEFYLNEEVDSQFNDIVLRTKEVPIEVIFSEVAQYKVVYYDNYNGVTTTTDLEDPKIAIYKDNEGRVVVETYEFETFIYESSTSRRYIQLYIPLIFVDAGNNNNKYSLYLESKKGDIHFGQLHEHDYQVTPKFVNLSITTNGKITLDTRRSLNLEADETLKLYTTNVKADTFTYKTSNSIVIPEDRINFIDAKNYDLESERGSITVETAVLGNLTAKTNDGNVKFVKCANLNVETLYGSVSCAKEDANAVVNANATITTHTGNIKLGSISGGEVSKITTTSGCVTIDKATNLIIGTKRGSVNIKEVNTLDVNTTTGKVTVLEVKLSAKVVTTRGNIYLGGETVDESNQPVTKYANNIDVYSSIGKVFVGAASGTVKIETVSSNIEFNNGESTSIDIISGGKLTAKNLMGNVTINAKKDISLKFTDIKMGVTKVTLEDTCKSAYIDAFNNTSSEVHYYLKGENVKLHEFKNNQRNQMLENSILENDNENPLFEVIGNNAVIDICFNASEQ